MHIQLSRDASKIMKKSEIVRSSTDQNGLKSIGLDFEEL